MTLAASRGWTEVVNKQIADGLNIDFKDKVCVF